MRKFLILMSLFIGFASTATLVSAQPTEAVLVDPITVEEQEALDALVAALAAATTTAEKESILADAIKATPSLATKSVLSASVERAATNSGLSLTQISAAMSLTRSSITTLTSDSSSIAEEEVLVVFIEEIIEDLTQDEIEELGDTFADLGIDVEISTATP